MKIDLYIYISYYGVCYLCYDLSLMTKRGYKAGFVIHFVPSLGTVTYIFLCNVSQSLKNSPRTLKVLSL